MTAGVTATIAVSAIGQYTASADITAVLQQINERFSLDIQPGTGTGKGDQMFADTRTLAASTSESLDLNTSSIKDAFGNALNFTKIRAIIIMADKANGALINMGDAASNAFVGPIGATGIVGVAAGDFHCFTSKVGWTVTASTGDLLKIANTDSINPANYSIILIGE